ncbi:MAG: FAD-dependent monooxygenase [Chloroflexi bacterium]|nr:FAD-dependent monooxygenase [Chloroflexota bacterium]
MAYDLIMIGGGLGGAALARVMAQAGAKVLVIERAEEFTDRNRGEWLAPWGVADAKKLGIYEALMAGGAHELPFFTVYGVGADPIRMPLQQLSQSGELSLGFYHPDVQTSLLTAAEDAGAEVLRGTAVRGLERGGEGVTVSYQNGSVKSVDGRFVVGADGRDSVARSWAGIDVVRGPQGRLGAGVILESVDVDPESGHIWRDFSRGCRALFFPQGPDHGRAYLTYPPDELPRLNGHEDWGAFSDESTKMGVPDTAYGSATVRGSLTTLDMTERWVDEPYQGHVAMIGDAAGATDPTHGQGMSITFRDVVALSDALKSHDDWDEAGHAYSESHNRDFRSLKTYLDWADELQYAIGPEADARRDHAGQLWREDPARNPMMILNGPFKVPTELDRQRYFGEV